MLVIRRLTKTMKKWERMKNSYNESLSHTMLECKYNIVFAPKFNRYKNLFSFSTITIPINNYCMQKNYGQLNRFHHN